MVQESVVGAESTYYLRFQIATSDCCVDRGSRYYCQRIILVWSVYVWCVSVSVLHVHN